MARSLWTGTISFGLVSVPVKLTTAVRDKSIHFHMLSPEGDCRLRRKLYCPDTGKEYDFKQASRGYEIAPGQYVLIDEDELDELKPEKGNTLEIEEFVELVSIDPIYYQKTYFLLPGEGGDKSYRLLVDAMQETRRAAIAHFSMRQKQHLAVIRPMDQALVLHTLHYADEVTTAADLKDELPEDVQIRKNERETAKQLIENLGDSFDPEQYHDEYRQRLAKVLEAKAEGEQIQVATEEAEPQAQTYNLMDALKKSVEQAKKKKSAKKRSRKSA